MALDLKYAPPPFFADPVLVDEVIQDFQTALASDLSAWLLFVYPKTKIGVGKNEDGSVSTYPQVYNNDGSGKYIDVRPNSKTRSFLFFEVNDPNTINIDRNADENSYDLSLVCWFNLLEIDSSRSEDFTMELVADTINSINAIAKYKGLISVDVDVEINPENIFDKYTLPQEDTQYLLYPYGGFKLNITVITFDDVDCIDPFVPGTPQDCQKLNPDSLLCQLIAQSPDQDITDCINDAGKFAGVCGVCPTCAVEINGTPFAIIPSGDTEDVPVLNTEATPLGSKIATDWIIGDIDLTIEDQDAVVLDTPTIVVKDQTIAVTVDKTAVFVSEFEENSLLVTETTIVDGENDGTYTTNTLTNVATVVYKVNAVVKVLPFTVVDTDVLEITITRTAPGDAKVKLNGTHP